MELPVACIDVDFFPETKDQEGKPHNEPKILWIVDIQVCTHIICRAWNET